MLQSVTQETPRGQTEITHQLTLGLEKKASETLPQIQPASRHVYLLVSVGIHSSDRGGALVYMMLQLLMRCRCVGLWDNQCMEETCTGE